MGIGWYHGPGDNIDNHYRQGGGDPVSPTILNKVVDAVVPVTLREVFGPQEALHGLGWAEEEQYIVFYIDNDRIVGRNPRRMQGVLMALVKIF